MTFNSISYSRVDRLINTSSFFKQRINIDFFTTFIICCHEDISFQGFARTALFISFGLSYAASITW
jgi:hypothetical protein